MVLLLLRGMLLHWHYTILCERVCISTAWRERSRRNNRIENSVWATGQCAAPSHRDESPLMNIFPSSLLAQRRNSNHAPVIGFFNFCILPASTLGRGLSQSARYVVPCFCFQKYSAPSAHFLVLFCIHYKSYPQNTRGNRQAALARERFYGKVHFGRRRVR